MHRKQDHTTDDMDRIWRPAGVWPSGWMGAIRRMALNNASRLQARCKSTPPLPAAFAPVDAAGVSLPR
jgi:hypothetical protein